ncbi:hypothetical protein [Methylobacterium sp. Leaf469]|uniref:hypothetical protein n=1 Tax=Methylobacterium sp. Leaf469 TaxID=1736387 RepID=UPI000AA626ED|nr:hypothetical protein [Methylobacterium sp. Leaf469]
MVGKAEYPGKLGTVPPGFVLAQSALVRFHEERITASEIRERSAERAHVTMVVTDALAAGTLVVFVRTQRGDIVPVPADAWRPHLSEPSRQHANVDRLHKSGLRHEDPLVLAHEKFTATGIALVDLNNWAGFSKYADRWPPYEIPASVRLLLKFCEHKEAISAGLPLQKSDAIEWFRQNWPWELQDRWPAEDRAGKIYNNKDNCPSFVSEFARVVLDEKERAGGAIPTELHKAVGDRRKRMAQRHVSDADFEAGLAIIDD